MQMTADIIKHRRDLVLRQLLHQAEQFLALHAHSFSVRNPTIRARSPRARCVPVRVVNERDSRSLTGTAACALTCGTAGQRGVVRSLPSWSRGVDSLRPLFHESPGRRAIHLHLRPLPVAANYAVMPRRAIAGGLLEDEHMPSLSPAVTEAAL
jgi:hypothetical protein